MNIVIKGSCMITEEQFMNGTIETAIEVVKSINPNCTMLHHEYKCNKSKRGDAPVSTVMVLEFAASLEIVDEGS